MNAYSLVPEMIYFNLESKIQERMLDILKPVTDRQSTQFDEFEKLRVDQARARNEIHEMQVALARSSQM